MSPSSRRSTAPPTSTRSPSKSTTRMWRSARSSTTTGTSPTGTDRHKRRRSSHDAIPTARVPEHFGAWAVLVPHEGDRTMHENSWLQQIASQLSVGAISRRSFIERAAATGIGAGSAVFMANTALAGSGPNGFAFYQGADGTPAASPTSGASGIPDVGMEGRTRGEGGQLRILQWQAPTHLNSHRSTGGKDFMAADIVSEPLLRYAEDGTLIANLVTATPSVENGLLAGDLSTVTFNLLPDVLWSDGEPFTSRDVRFTWQWISTESNASINITSWSVIESIETPDELTAVVTYKAPSAAWFEAFTGGYIGHIYPAHAFGDDPANPNEDFLLAPIGTGPYKVESISPNDQAIFVINENYRFPNKPFFESVLLKGGGDSASAALE